MSREGISDAVVRITEMEGRLDKATMLMDELEEAIRKYEDYQSEIRILEEYYTGDMWKCDLALDEAGSLPQDLKRGVLSEDGIYNLLERNKEIRREQNQ